MHVLTPSTLTSSLRFWGELAYHDHAFPDQHAHLLAPSTPGPHPLVLCVHGGGWTQGMHHGYLRVAIPLARHGFAAAAVGYRKVSEAPWPAPLEDLESAYAFFQRHTEAFDLDPDRTAAVGDSAGGHLALMLSTVCELSAVVSISGPTDVRPPVITSSLKPYQDLCAHPECPREEVAESASPVLAIRSDSCPILQLIGSGDDIVPPTQSANLKQRLDRLGVPNERILFEGAGHGLVFEREEEVRSRMFGFLDAVFQELQHRDHGRTD